MENTQTTNASVSTATENQEVKYTPQGFVDLADKTYLDSVKSGKYKELLPKPTPPMSEIEVVKSNVAEDMRKLGIASLAEYVEYLKQLAYEVSDEYTFVEGEKQNKFGMEM